MQLTVRLEEEVVKEIDALAELLSRPGMPATRADAMRVAIETGLPHQLEALRKGSPKPSKKSAKK